MINVDATSYIAHIMFESNDNLGVMYQGYQTGEWLTVAEGTTLDLVVYNGKSTGSLDFKFIYSSSAFLSASVATVLTLAAQLAL